MKNFYLLMAFVFTAFSVNAQIVYSADFEAGIPSDVTQTTLSTDGGWSGGTVAALSSQYWEPADNGSNVVGTNDDGCNCDKSEDYLILPAMDLSADGLILTFDVVFAGGTYQGSTEELTVKSSDDGGATWTTVSEIAGSGNLAWRTEGLSLASVAGPSVMLAFHYNDGGGWTFGSLLDNVTISIPDPNNAALAMDIPARYVIANEDLNVSGTITNLSGNTITSADVEWTLSGGATNTETITGLSIAPFESAAFTHMTPLVPGTDLSEVSAEITAVNGSMDPDMSDNSGMFSTTGIAAADVPTKTSVFEEGTGTWCGWCPRGHVFMAYMEDTYDDFLGVAVHNSASDPMTNSAYDSGFGAYVSGYPSGAADRSLRYIDIDPTEFEDAYNELKSEVTPALVSITDISADMATRELSVTVEANFRTNLSGDYRLGLIITENGVTGTTAGYNQTNFYSNENQNIALTGAGHDWQADPDPVPAADMVYDHVGREVVGGFNGAAGSLPATINYGETHSYTFTYTLPATWNTADMHVIATLNDLTETPARIWNAAGGTVPNIEGGSANEDLLPANSVEVFPNPATDVSFVRVNLEDVSDVTVNIFNNLGQVVYTRNLELNGDMIIPVDSSNFASGIYQVNVNVDGKFITKKLVIR